MEGTHRNDDRPRFQTEGKAAMCSHWETDDTRAVGLCRAKRSHDSEVRGKNPCAKIRSVQPKEAGGS